MKQRSIGVCIPVWNRGRLFKICFDALVKNLKGLEATIWIFDNGSDRITQNIIEHLHSPACRLHKVFFPVNMGIPYVANVFAQAVKQDCRFQNYRSPEYVLLMDSDAYFKKPIKDLVRLMESYSAIGVLSGHDSPEHPSLEEKHIKLHGQTLLLKEKDNERMLTMLMRKEDFLLCTPFPHHSPSEVDWEIAQWNPNSMSKRGKKIVVACDYALHLGIDHSTWNKALMRNLATEEEKAEVERLLKKFKLQSGNL